MRLGPVTESRVLMTTDVLLGIFCRSNYVIWNLSRDSTKSFDGIVSDGGKQSSIVLTKLTNPI